MNSQLILAARHLDPDLLARFVPPRVAAGAIAPLQWTARTDYLSLACPLPDLENVREILPCFSCLSESAYGYQFTLEFTTRTEASLRRVDLDPIGDFQPAVAASALRDSSVVESAVDQFIVKVPLESALLRLVVSTVGSADLQRVPALLSVSTRRADGSTASEKSRPNGDVDLAVPCKSQMLLDPEISAHVCSPTCLSMLLDYHGRRTDVYEVIRQVRHAPSGLYGVWPASVHVASRRGMLGYLLHFPSWDAARALLDLGLPIIASIRYEEGELTRSPIPRTSGHLLVIRGYDASAVRVNDPAAPSADTVCREYDLKEFTRIWLGRAGVGYVIFPGESVSK